MADFLGAWWGVGIAVLVLLSITGCAVLLWSQSKMTVQLDEHGQPLPPETTGHVWDGNLCEHNNPLPRWWMGLFYLTIVFGFVYLVFYPGLGNFQGTFGWSQTSAYQAEMKAGEQQYGPLFNRYLAMDIPAVAKDPQAHAIGQRLFLNYCAQCHGSDAQGSKGFPNLTDKDWLYGGDPKTIEASISEGRRGQMPPMGAALGSDVDVRNVANYVLSLSNATYDPIAAVKGKSKFVACAACHGPDGKGNQTIGAPNLTDKTWLYGGSIGTIMETINKGRINQMPTHKNFLDDGKIHVLAAYVWSLSNSVSSDGK